MKGTRTNIEPAPTPGNSEADALKETADKLRELDQVDADLGADFYNRMHDQIMSRIVTEVSVPRPNIRKNAGTKMKAKMVSLIQTNL